MTLVFRTAGLDCVVLPLELTEFGGKEKSKRRPKLLRGQQLENIIPLILKSKSVMQWILSRVEV
jgi:hypothetical protein